MELIRWVASLAPVAILAAAQLPAQEAPTPISGEREVLIARIDDAAITPVTADFLARAIEEAELSNAVCLIIQLDTPGGLMQSTREIVKQILGSNVPVVVYVAPSGARAASAGVFITLASHVAAMAPATHIGAAHPVQIGGSPGPGPGPGPDPGPGSRPAAPDNNQDSDPASDSHGEAGQTPMDEKVLNDATAWVRTLAELRGRNVEWAVASVAESKSIPSSEAVDLNVVDLIASDIDDLLSQLDGRVVEIRGDSLRLETKNATIINYEMWWGDRILSVVSNPNVAFLLLMLGFYGLFFELYTPGWGIAGTLGAICLILAFFGLAVLPINYAGLLLIFLAIGLFVAEAFITSFGMLTLGGTVCLILGGIMLVDTPVPVMKVSLSVLVPVAIGTGVVAFFLAGRAFSSFRLRVQTGTEAMVGMVATADEDFSTHENQFRGRVSVHGELWRAISDKPVAARTELVVTGCKGLTLSVASKTKANKGG